MTSASLPSSGRGHTPLLAAASLPVVGAGGLFMHVRDFLAWDRNFYDGKVGGPRVLELMHSTEKLTDGKANDYAFGLSLGNYRGLKTVEHGGAYGGYRAHMLRFPEQKFSVAIFANIAAVEPDARAKEIADLHLADVVTAAAAPEARRPPPPTASTLELSAKQLAQYTGEYFNDELQATYRLTERDGKLFVKTGYRAERPLLSLEPDVFGLDYGRLVFQRKGKAVRGFSLDMVRVSDLQFVKR